MLTSTISVSLYVILLLLLLALHKAMRSIQDLQEQVQKLGADRQQDLARHEEECRSLKDQHKAAIDRAMTGARSQFKGMSAEKLYPVLQNCPYDPREMQFLGDPVDYLVFPGMSEGEVREVVLLEIKTGKSKRSQRQRQIQKAVQEHRVRFENVALQDPLEGQ